MQIHCKNHLSTSHSNYVPLTIQGQPDKLEKLTIYGVCISAEDPSMVIMHDML